ncbi:hypothetical protein [Alicyclobacillus herbarius]|uniref:hypothetical protein n=1 Tax=Alicyclobacillus herbarius TaxID=122960 RepID=UPI0012DFA82C|nr:hypothetical protein [Alicyclobacillus herbarius]
MTEKIPDKHEQNYVTALILGLSGRNLTESQKQLLEEAMKMTDIVRELWAKAEREGWQKGLERGLQQGLEQGRKEGRKETSAHVAFKMLMEGMDPEVVMKITGLSRKELDTLRRNLN